MTERETAAIRAFERHVDALEASLEPLLSSARSSALHSELEGRPVDQAHLHVVSAYALTSLYWSMEICDDSTWSAFFSVGCSQHDSVLGTFWNRHARAPHHCRTGVFVGFRFRFLYFMIRSLIQKSQDRIKRYMAKIKSAREKNGLSLSFYSMRDTGSENKT